MFNLIFSFFILSLGVSEIPLSDSTQDLTLLGTLQPNQEEARSLTIPSKSDINITVTPQEDKIVSCQFIDQSGLLGLEQINVTECNGHLKTSNPMTLTVKVTNPNKEVISYQIRMKY